MSTPAVFNEWVDGAARDIERLAEQNAMRRVLVANEILRPAGSEYWTVVYELQTWPIPNDMTQTPEITRGGI